MGPLDALGKPLKVGDTVVRGVSLNRGGSCGLEVRQVTHVIGMNVYLNGSPIALKFPERLAIVTPKE